MERVYKITQSQFEDIDHLKRMFEHNAERIRKLCSEERSDVVYGFELGEIHSHLRECFMKMDELEDNISNSRVKN